MLSAVRFAAVCCLAWGIGSPLLAADAPSPEQLEFFEKQVRPLLVEHCSECHGAKKSEAGLRLDTKRGFAKGSDTGPIVVAGNVDASRLMKVLSYREGDTQMPPKGKLSDEKIAVFKKWLELGSPWPDEAAGAADGSSAKNHWAFQPVKRPSIPEVRSAECGVRSESHDKPEPTPLDPTSSSL
ncbi:MAG: c-type cytochrome domain-containing protein, partial [Planctomycetota bacterium]